MRRYRFRLRPVCALEAMGPWPSGGTRTSATTYAPSPKPTDRPATRPTHLREAIYWQDVNAIFDDRLLRALLKDRAAGAGTQARP